MNIHANCVILQTVFILTDKENEMAIYRDVIVKIPEGAYTAKDGSVFVKDRNEYNPEKRYNEVRHTIIGRSIGNGQMYPNHNFRFRYPALFEQATGLKPAIRYKRIGFFAAVLSLTEKNGLYEALVSAYGAENANRLLDFSIYALLFPACAAEEFSDRMEDQLLFSSPARNSSGSFDFVSLRITKDETCSFRKLWTNRCRERGTKEVWIAADGLNDRDALGAGADESGNANSSDRKGRVWYLCAVDSRNGAPVSFAACREERGVSLEVLQMAKWLNTFDIKVKGVIVNSCLSAADVLESFALNRIPFVALLQEESNAHERMVKEYGAKIDMNYRYMLRKYTQHEIEENELKPRDCALFGIESLKKIQLFPPCSFQAYAYLIRDAREAMKQTNAWFRNVTNAARRIQGLLHKGEEVFIPKEYESCLSIEEESGEKYVEVDEENVQKRGKLKGFVTLASSEKMTALSIYEIFSMGIGFFEQLSVIKRQMGFKSEGTAYPEKIQTELILSFVCAILKQELMKAGEKAELSADKIIQEINQVLMQQDEKDRYAVCHTENQRQIFLLNACGVRPENLERIAEEENKRMGEVTPDPIRRFPVPDEKPNSRRGPGRPKGSKNRIPKTTESTGKEKRKPGRPPGAKNKKTLEREALEKEARTSKVLSGE